MLLKLGPVFTSLDILGHLEDFRFFDHFQTKLFNAKHFQIGVFVVEISEGAVKHVKENEEERFQVVLYRRNLRILMITQIMR